jgi:hypothetical protein
MGEELDMGFMKEELAAISGHTINWLDSGKTIYCKAKLN